jgi:DNA-binding NarL/FixJ family response regulator
LTYVEGSCPDLLLLDWGLHGLVHEELAILRRMCPSLCVITLSGRPEVRQAALCAGTDAFVSKSDPPERLLEAITECQLSLEKGSVSSSTDDGSHPTFDALLDTSLGAPLDTTADASGLAG